MSKKLSLQDLQKKGGVDLSPKDTLYLTMYASGRLDLSHGDKLRYLIKRGYMTKDKVWTPLGNAALKAVYRERTQSRQKKEREIDGDRHETTGGTGGSSELVDPEDS